MSRWMYVTRHTSHVTRARLCLMLTHCHPSLFSCTPCTPCPSCTRTGSCPNSSYKEPCPSGYWCQTKVLPQLCNYLSDCPEGTADPPVSYLVLVVLAGCMAAWAVTAFIFYQCKWAQEADDLVRVRGVEQTAVFVNLLLKNLLMRTSHNQTRRFFPFEGLSPNYDALAIRFSNLSVVYDRTRGTYGLQGMSCAIPDSKLVAIMGPSGSGKTTFLKVLHGTTTGELTGDVAVNGRPVKDLTAYHHEIGYVPQESLLHSELTVRVRRYAQLRLSSPCLSGR
jgi:ABC-type multidrug transport system fused ATPase/permease subunit